MTNPRPPAHGALRWCILLSALMATMAMAGLSTAQAPAGTAAASRSGSNPYPPGLSTHAVEVAGLERQYAVHVPLQLATSPQAIVLVLHGGGGVGLDVTQEGRHPLSAFRAVAGREGFVVVYPLGSSAADGRAGWSDCRADDRTHGRDDDVAFLTALLERLSREYALPASRLFMAGGSNGAMMTHAMAIARPDLLGAVATAGGSLAATPKLGACAQGPKRPLPILMAHGTADTQMPYEGGCVANLGGRCNRGQVISAPATRDQWLQANGLSGAEPTQQVVERDTADAGPAVRFDYAGPNPVQWWRLDGAGHAVPSRSVRLPSNRLTGVQNRDVEFAEIAWAFFKERLATR